MAMSERDSLDMWRRVLMEIVRSDGPDMTARQQAILMTVSLTSGPHTVRGLAEALDIAKPAVTRALDALEKHGLIKRVPDERDLRSVLIERTIDGTAYLRDFARLIVDAGTDDKSASNNTGRRAAA